MIPTNERIQYVTFSTPTGDYPGANLHDWFDGSEYLAYDPINGIHTLTDRINASFTSRKLAMDWLEKSYSGKDTEGVGVIIDGEPLDDTEHDGHVPL